ncbi:rhomboid family intramembrane serine protease [uncultured Litoreibacter sp.]|uniref:rhomboid family intramembrane serine protease n=1 Tax=uncultured Litoreibacter sp. TaxID=1392394 RepID=UPI00262EA4F9|nr:rhomboid family intramembrane serine protease [uncultured Litoreibacter sp.]
MSELRDFVVTTGVIVLLLGAYAMTGATHSLRYQDGLGDAFAGVLRHGDLSHLGGNILVIFFGGLFAEPRLGRRRTLVLILACVLLGTIAQFYISGPKFVGASGISYGLLSYGVLADRTRGSFFVFSACLFVLLVSEWLYLSQTFAVYVHISGALIGGSFVMFEKLFGSKSPTLKPMQHVHIAKVVSIIDQTDSDDAKEAEDEFFDGGLEQMFVLMQKGEVIGVTGYSLDEQVHDIAWLSWTYLDQDHLGTGLGSQMLNDLLGKLKDFGIRKIFIATSDYRDFGRDIYAGAHKMYEDFGAVVELKVPDYHNPSEAKIVYGLNNPEYEPEGEEPVSTNTGLAINDVAPEPETKNVMGLVWEERPVGMAGLDYALEKAAKKSARMVVLAIPSDISEENAVALEAQGFIKCGSLEGYYNPSLHQVWWSCSLTQ